MVVFFAGNERYKALFQRYVGPSIRLSSTLTDADVVIALPNGCVNAWKSEDGKTLVDLSLLPSAGLDELRGFVEGVLPESDDSFSFFSPSSVRIVVEEGAGSILSTVFPSFSISVVPDVEEHRRRYVLSSIAMAFTFLFSLPLDALVHSPAFPRLFRMVSSEVRAIFTALGMSFKYDEVESVLSSLPRDMMEVASLQNEKNIVKALLASASRSSIKTPYLNFLSVLLEAREDVIRYT